MPDLERLVRFVTDAPTGTLVPVDALRELLVDSPDAPPRRKPERELSAAEAAEWLHNRLGGRKRTAAAVRKVMRTGFRGVILNSYLYGRERRTTEADLQRFVEEIGAVPQVPQPQRTAVPARTPTASAFQVESQTSPADEIAAAQQRFGRDHAVTAGGSERRRTASGR